MRGGAVHDTRLEDEIQGGLRGRRVEQEVVQTPPSKLGPTQEVLQGISSAHN